MQQAGLVTGYPKSSLILERARAFGSGRRSLVVRGLGGLQTPEAESESRFFRRLSDFGQFVLQLK